MATLTESQIERDAARAEEAREIRRRVEIDDALRDLHAYLKSGSPLDAEFRRVWDENLDRLYEP